MVSGAFDEAEPVTPGEAPTISGEESPGSSGREVPGKLVECDSVTSVENVLVGVSQLDVSVERVLNVSVGLEMVSV